MVPAFAEVPPGRMMRTRCLDHAKAAGFDHHLTKPVDLEKLRALVGQG